MLAATNLHQEGVPSALMSTCWAGYSEEQEKQVPKKSFWVMDARVLFCPSFFCCPIGWAGMKYDCVEMICIILCLFTNTTNVAKKGKANKFQFSVNNGTHWNLTVMLMTAWSSNQTPLYSLCVKMRKSHWTAFIQARLFASTVGLNILYLCRCCCLRDFALFVYSNANLA